MEGDLMIMSPVLNGIEIPANGSIELVSGGYHLMLIDLQSDLHEDDHFPLALQFEQSGQVIVSHLSPYILFGDFSLFFELSGCLSSHIGHMVQST